MWKYGAWLSRLKRKSGWGFLKVYHFYIYKLFYFLLNCVIHLKKNFFFCHHNLIKKNYSDLSKMNLGVCKEDWCVKLGQEGFVCVRELSEVP